MKTQLKRILSNMRLHKVGDTSDWLVYDCEEDGGCYELEQWSDAGEDVIITLRGATLAELAAALVAVELKGKHGDDEPIWDSERRAIVGFNPGFGTVQTFGTEEEAQRRASSALDAAIDKLKANGYTLLCAPKTIETDNHDWRRISRVKSPHGKRIALIAYAPWIDASFDPWIY